MGMNSTHRICILGGTGFVGHHLASRLSRAGHPCRILSRHPHRHRDLRVLPGVEVQGADLFDPPALARGLAGCRVVVNLVGILNETHAGAFRRLHVELVERVLDAARAAGVPRYLHMSALNADARAGTSVYLRSKGEGEDLAHARDEIGVTSFRPAVIFGPGDSFFNRFARLLRLSPGVFPLPCPDARLAPVYVGDVAAMMTAALPEAHAGRRYDLCGPRIFTLKELVEYTAHTLGRRTRVIGLSAGASRLQARVLQHLPGAPFTPDNLRTLETPAVCGHNALPEAGIRPTDIVTVVPGYLGRAPRR